MLSTALGIQFTVNDLDSTYEVFGSSDNYSFTYNLGKGSDLVDFEGQVAQKSIGLKGNYGKFSVRVFATSDIGVRSAFIQGSVDISPPEFDGTFEFSDIQISNLPENSNIGKTIEIYPDGEGNNLLAVNSEFIDKNIVFDWKLTPPLGHPKEGLSLGNELLEDPLFSHFSLKLKNTLNGNEISDSELNVTSNQGLQGYLNTNDVAGDMENYKSFSFQLSPLVFEELSLDRNLSLEVVCHDKFGNTSTGIISGTNYLPEIEDLSYSLFGSKVGFAWSYSDTDYQDTKIKSLAIPSSENIYSTTDFNANVSYYEKLSAAPKWSNNKPNWVVGECCHYNEIYYECISSYNQIDHPTENPETLNSKWQSKGNFYETFLTEDVYVGNNASFNQIWGYNYYYCFTPRDGYGEGNNFNVTEDGIVEYGGADSELYAFKADVRIGNLGFIEREDDLIFRWNVVDQDQNLVDLNQYKFLVSPNDSPEILGISGSLFDPESNDFLTGITEGLNSKSATSADGVLQVNQDLPGAKVFETFDFTRDLNNQLYKHGGFPESAQPFVRGSEYSLGEKVTFGKQLFKANHVDPIKSVVPDFVFPQYETWDVSESYLFVTPSSISSNSIVEYESKIFAVTGSVNDQVIGPEADNVDGIFDFTKSYSAGDIIIAPVDFNILMYDSTVDYPAGEVVIHNGYIYRCLVSSNSDIPGESTTSWLAESIFDRIECKIYKALSSTVGQHPEQFPSVWQEQNPETSDEYVQIIDSYDFLVNNFSEDERYFPGRRVIYENDVYECLVENGLGASNGIQVPSSSSAYWTQTEGDPAVDISTSHVEGDLVLHDETVYRCLADNPTGAPLDNILNSSTSIYSSYENSQWAPFWEIDESFTDLPFGFVGIPESGNREVGIELGILDSNAEILNLQRTVGFNNAPSILANGFEVDSLSKVTTTSFNFKYANEAREKVIKLQLYRSSDPEFSITGSDGLPGAGSPNFVKEVFGPSEQDFGENINFISDDNPNLPYTYESKPPDRRGDGITGYYYKLLPFDDFGSGDLFTVRDNQDEPERILIYPFHYSNSNPDGFMGPAFGKTEDAIPGPVENLEGDTAFVNYFLDWEIPKSEFLEGAGTLLSLPNDISHYEVWQSEDNYLYFGAEDKFLTQERNLSGYRKITGDLTSIAHQIPIEQIDPASGITNANNVLDASALGPRMSITHRGEVNDKRYFWVRAVDHGGNKGPFTGKAGTDDVIEGLELVLGQQSPTDISDFEQNITNAFPNTVALVPNNPFKNHTPQDKSISWDRHFLYIEGEGYVIGDPTSPKFLDPNGVYDENRVFTPSDPPSTEQGRTTDAYVYFKPDEAIEINQSELEELGLASPGEKVKLLKGQVTNASTPSFNSFSVDSELVSQSSFSPITASDPGTYIKFLSNNLAGQEREIDTYDAIDGTITTKRPFVGSPAVGDDFEIIREVPLSSEQNNPLRNIKYTGDYRTSNYHPAGEGETTVAAADGRPGEILVTDGKKPRLIDDGDKIIARNSEGIAVPMWHAFANATIGTAHIQKAAITNAKIHNLTADKIRSAKVLSQDIQIGGTAESGQIRSAGFGKPVGKGFDGHEYVEEGFVISGNGSFMFKGDDTNEPGGKLYYENGQLTIEGNLKQRDGSDLAVVNMYAEPDIFTYDEDANGDFIPNPPSQEIEIINFFTNSSMSASDVKYKMQYPDGVKIFDYDDDDADGKYDLNGFSYDPGEASSFDEDLKKSVAKFKVDDDGFDKILGDRQYSDLSVVVFASGVDTLVESSVTISTNLQGPVGETGRSPVYRGVWNENSCYNGLEDQQTLRGDVVYFNNLDQNKPGAPGGDFYIAKKDSGPVGNCGAGFPGYKQPKGYGPAGVVDSEYWKIFGAQFESVATKLLLANDAIITNTLSMGVNDPIENPNNPGGGSGGTIESAGFIGGLDPANGLVRTTEDYGTPGFRLRRAKDSSSNSFVIFDIGGKYELQFNDWEEYDSAVNYNVGDVVSFTDTSDPDAKPRLYRCLVLHTSDIPGQNPADPLAPGWSDQGEDSVNIDSYMRFSSSNGRLQIHGASFDGSISDNSISSPNDLYNNIDHIASNFSSFIGGGFNNNFLNEQSNTWNQGDQFPSIAAAIVGGARNKIQGRFSFIGAGFDNICKDTFSVICGGHSNTMPVNDSNNAGTNLIGAGNNNQISGGSSQSIVVGDDNIIAYNKADTTYLTSEGLLNLEGSFANSKILGNQGYHAEYGTVTGWITDKTWFIATRPDGTTLDNFGKGMYIAPLISNNSGNTSGVKGGWLFEIHLGWLYFAGSTGSYLSGGIYTNSILGSDDDPLYAYSPTFLGGGYLGFYRGSGTSLVGPRTDYVWFKSQYISNSASMGSWTDGEGVVFYKYPATNNPNAAGFYGLIKNTSGQSWYVNIDQASTAGSATYNLIN